MCGLLGFIAGADNQIPVQKLESALKLLAHRGPDGKGTHFFANVWFGHTRLSIIDLSKAGNQPMIDPFTGNVIVYNGEIYNYIELRAELAALGHQFATQTDTEVLLRAYAEWGVRCLERLNGVWAFAIHNVRDKKVFLARDRFGVKPLCYVEDRTFAFASEPKALLEVEPSLREVNVAALVGFIAHGRYMGGTDTFYKTIKSVPAGHAITIDLRTLAVNIFQYWEYPAQTHKQFSHRDFATKFAEIFQDAVRLRHRSDVPVAIALSGGLDSCSILAASSRLPIAPLTCYTSSYSEQGFDEVKWAKIAAQTNGNRLKLVALEREEVETLAPAIVYHLDSPCYSPAVFPLYKLLREVRANGIRVLLEGQGADEILAGYVQHALVAFMEGGGSPFRVDHWLNLAKQFSPSLTARWLGRLIFPRVFGFVKLRRGAMATLLPRNFEQAKSMRLHNDYFGGLPLHDSLVVAHRESILPGLLHYGDAISMAASVETRQPFLDYRLVTLTLNAIAKKFMVDGIGKMPIRRFLRSEGYKQIAARMDKRGYVSPVENWLLDEKTGFASKYLLAADAMISHYCDPIRIKSLIATARSNSGLANHVFRLFMVEMWLRRCIYRKD